MVSVRVEQDKPSGRVIVTGASSLIGRFLLPRLSSAGFQVMAISRNPPRLLSIKGSGNVQWHRIDESLEGSIPSLSQASTLIHLAPLWLLPRWLEDFASLDGRRVIAFGSTSRFSKLTSSIMEERNVAEELATAELGVASMCECLQIAWTIFRPTLVYGAGLDKNISTIAGLIRRWGFFPIVGEGRGLRQPVHADDLALACLVAVNRPATFNRAYNLVGGETITYRAMVEAIFVALDKRPVVISIPERLLKTAIQILRWFRPFRHLTTAMASRMSVDLCFDSSDAMQDFGYAPRGFREGIRWDQAQRMC